MGSAKSVGRLIPATPEHVDGWVREAWSGQNTYPTEPEIYALTSRINTIVDSANASPSRDHSTKAAKKRRTDLLTARTRAGALRKALSPVMQYLQTEREMFSFTAVRTNAALANQISTIDQMQCAIDAFIKLPLPRKSQDHMDPVLWLEQAVKQAWSGVESRQAGERATRVSFGKKPDGPLVTFISYVLEGIRLAGDDISNSSLETISDHLRKRQNRPRNRNAMTAKVGA